MNPLNGEKRQHRARSNVTRGYRDVFDLEEKGESVVVRLLSAPHSTLQNQRSAAGLPPSTTNDGVWRRGGQVRWDHSVVCLSTLKVIPRLGSNLWVSPAELRWTHSTIQRLCSCERRLQDVATSLQQGAEQPSDLPMFGIVGCQKWYPRSNGGCGASQRPL